MNPLTRAVLSLAAAAALGPVASGATLLLRYSFDEASSGAAPALDSGSMPAAPGTFVGPVTRTSNTPAGFSLGALDLTAPEAPDHVSAGDIEKLDGLTQLTLTAWINLRGAPVNGNRIMAKQLTSGNFDGFSFAFSTPTTGTISADAFQLNLALGGAAFAFNTSGADLSANDQWVFVAVSYDGTLSSDNVKFYRGDTTSSVAQFGLTRTAAVGTLTPNSNEFRVGASSGGTGNSPPDYLDDVRVYDGVLSDAELESVRASNIPEPSTTALLLGALLLTSHRAARRHVASREA